MRSEKHDGCVEVVGHHQHQYDDDDGDDDDSGGFGWGNPCARLGACNEVMPKRVPSLVAPEHSVWFWVGEPLCPSRCLQ